MSKTPRALFLSSLLLLALPEACRTGASRAVPDGATDGDDAGSARRDGGRLDAGRTDSGGSARPDGGTTSCLHARRLFFENFEGGDYSSWTSMTYGADWNGGRCHATALSQAFAVSGSSSERSEITCSYQPQPHRGYGGLQFSGDDVVPRYTNQGTGISAPNGVVNTYWSRLDVPYAFGDGRWFSFFTVDGACDYSEAVITLSLEDSTNRLVPGHIENTGGHTDWETNVPGFPLGEWVRTTLYINYETGEMIVWMNGTKLLRSTFSRPTQTLCQFHWGAYASGDNDDVVLYEDDISLWKLEEPLTDLSVEPWLDGARPPCE